jgi:hypothetical protein
MNSSSEYLDFRRGESASGKTAVVSIYSVMHGDKLGEIRWMGRWRQYALYPGTGTIWNPGCLEAVNAVIGGLMAERRNT